jgi:hypothetical protein
MIDINIDNNPELYFDYIKGLEFLKNISDDDYNYPDDITNFHIYSEIRNDKELECVKSYFATQNLDKTKLIIWSDYEISEQDNLKEFKDKIDFRIYNPIKEAEGTILEGKIEQLLAKDNKYYLQSDLLRLLALQKYGGIWIDMDIILLRDFKPLLDQEYLYQWGGDTDFDISGCCATVISLKKNSELSNLLLSQILKMPIIGDTTIWGKDLFAKVYKNYKYNILPSTFFNTEWLMSKIDRKLSDDILTYWFDNECDDKLLFTEAFAWHWHNSSNKNKSIVKNSKFDKLRVITDKKLKKRNEDIICNNDM